MKGAQDLVYSQTCLEDRWKDIRGDEIYKKYPQYVKYGRILINIVISFIVNLSQRNHQSFIFQIYQRHAFLPKPVGQHLQERVSSTWSQYQQFL